VHPLLRHLRVLWRVEAAITEMRLRVVIRRGVLCGLAAMFAALAVGMLNVAAYVGLVPLWGAMWAAIATALGDLALALICVAVALAMRPGPELDTALELRRAALDGVEAEVNPVLSRVGWLSRLTRDPIEAALPALLMPLITAIIRGMCKAKGEK